MKYWKKSKERKKLAVVLTVLVVVLIVKVIAFIQFNVNLYEMSLKHAIPQVEELSTYLERVFQLELERCIQVLKSSEALIHSESDIGSSRVRQSLEEICEVSGFRMIGIMDLEGQGVNTEGDKQYVPSDYFKQKIKNEEIYISNAWKEEGQVGEQILIAVPLHINGKVCGAMWGKYALSDIVDAIELLESSPRYFQIIDDKGKYISASKNKYALGTEGCIWEEMENYTFPDGTTPAQIRGTVESGGSGNFFFESGTQGRYVSYRPLGINNWYLFSIQVSDALHTYVRDTQRITMRFFSVIVMGLIILFAMIYGVAHSMYKTLSRQHRQLMSINSVFKLILQNTRDIPFTVDMVQKQVVLYGYPTKDAVRYYSFDEVCPDAMLQAGYISEESLADYQRLYNSVLQQEECESVVIYTQAEEKRGWIRITVIADGENECGQIIGVLENYNEHKEKDAEIEQHLKQIKKIQKESKIDFLTGLYNREALMQAIKDVLADKKTNQGTDAFMMLDLDHFKEVNDLMGHRMGDKVLKNTAQTLRGFFRKGDIIGRLGGDEFVLLIRNIDDLDSLGRRAEKLNQLLCKTYEKDGKSVTVSASIGIALADAKNVHFTDLYEQADKALYEVKQTARNGYKIYSV